MIFQEPMTALNPVLTVGFQIAEAVRAHHEHAQTECECASRAIDGQSRNTGCQEPTKGLSRISFPGDNGNES